MGAISRGDGAAPRPSCAAAVDVRTSTHTMVRRTALALQTRRTLRRRTGPLAHVNVTMSVLDKTRPHSFTATRRRSPTTEALVDRFDEHVRRPTRSAPILGVVVRGGPRGLDLRERQL